MRAVAVNSAPENNFSLLQQAISEKRNCWEQSRQELLAVVLAWLNDNAADYGIDRAYLFGSLTQPSRFTPRSDVDVAVETIAPETFFVAMAALSEAVERDVDLVLLDMCPFADRIRQTGVIWTNAPSRS